MHMPFRVINSDASSDPTTVYLLNTLNHALSCMLLNFLYLSVTLIFNQHQDAKKVCKYTTNLKQQQFNIIR